MNKFGYSGRLVNTNGLAVTGSADLKFDLSYSGDPTAILDTTGAINDVPLANGVFTVELEFLNFDSILAALPPSEQLLITVTDQTTTSSPVVYDPQSIFPVPMARIAGSVLDNSITANKLSVSCSQDQVVSFNSDGDLACADNGLGSVSSVTGAPNGAITVGGDAETPNIAVNVDNSTIEIASNNLRIKPAASTGQILTTNGGNALWASMYCSTAGQYLRGIDASGAVECATPADNTLSAGNGIDVTGGVASVKINASPSVAGLDFNGVTGELFVLDSEFQRTIADACGPGEAIVAIANNGSATCAPMDTDLEGQSTACSDDQILKASAGNFVCANAAEVGIWALNSGDTYYNDGNVGIGTDTPTSKLHLVDNQDATVQVQIRNEDETSASATSRYVLLGASSGVSIEKMNAGYIGSGARRARAGAVIDSSSTGLNLASAGATSDMRLYTGGISDAHERLRIANGGNVGIGTASPTEKLEVNGNIKVTTGNDVCIDGGACLSSSGSGDITEVNAGAGLLNGATSGAVTLDVDVGTGANQIVQLDGSGKLPAVDGSELTNLPNPTTSTTLSGFSAGADSPILGSDSVLNAFQKTQGQINASNTAIASNTSALGSLDTDDVSEASNLYHTIARARSASVVNSTAGSQTDQASSVSSMKSYVAAQIGGIDGSKWAENGSDISFSGGSVGVGTTAPDVMLDVVMQPIVGTHDLVQQKLEFNFSDTPGSNPTNAMVFKINGPNVSGTQQNTEVAMIKGVREDMMGSPMAQGRSGHLAFSTNHLGSMSEKMRITNAGNVGIGTTAPSEKLNVAGNILLDSVTRPGINFKKSNTLQEWSIVAGAGNSLHIKPSLQNTDSSDMDAHVSVNTDGNVGIGTTAPSAKLSIVTDNPLAATLSSSGLGMLNVQRFHSRSTSNQNRYGEIVLDPENNWWGLSTLSSTTGNLPSEGDSPALAISGGGNVGIGNVSPNAKLDVTGEVKADELYVDKTGDYYDGGGSTAVDRWVRIGQTQSPYTEISWGKILVHAWGRGSSHAEFSFTCSGFGHCDISVDKFAHPSSSTNIQAASGIKGVRIVYDTGGFANPAHIDVLMRNDGFGYSRMNAYLLYGKSVDLNDTLTEASTDTPARTVMLNDSAAMLSNSFANGQVNFTRAGNVGIKTADPSYTLHVNGSVAGVGAYNSLSDERFKKNFTPISDTAGTALEKVLSLNGKYYEWRQDEYPEMEFDQGRDIGLIAQEVERVFPEAVSEAQTGIKSVAYSKLIGPLVEAVKELFGALQKDKAVISREISSLKKQNEKLERENEQIKDLLCEIKPKAALCLKSGS